MEMLLAIGICVGLASVAGVRAFLPLALGIVSYISFALFGNPSQLVLQISEWLNLVVIGALFVLAVLECVLDKLAALDRFLNWAMVPIRIVAGALLSGMAWLETGPVVSVSGGTGTLGNMALSQALPSLAPWLVLGGGVAGVVAVLKVVLRPPASAVSSGVSTSFLSFVEDVIGLVGGVLALFVPFLPVLFVAFLLFFFSRIRKRRGRKFGGLRILGD